MHRHSLPGAAAVLLGMTAFVHAGPQPVAPQQHVFIPPLSGIQGYPAEAGSSGGGGGFAAPSDPTTPSEEPLATPTTPLTTTTTQDIVETIDTAMQFCNGLTDKEYVVDCLSYEFWQIQERLPEDGEYADVKVSLRQAADELGDIVRENRSNTKSPGVASRGGDDPRRTTRPLAPVRSDRLGDVNERAAQVIENAQVRLLRSSGNSERRRIQYRSIATAMDTGTVLLRSI